MNRPTLLDLPPKEHPELLATWELAPHLHEVWHAGHWRRIVEVQPVGLNGPNAERAVYLILDGPIVTRTVSSIDRETGLVSKRTFTVREGPVLVRPLSAVGRARRCS